MNIVAIIPARGGSKGIPKKNIKLLYGKPLIAYSIEAAKSSKLVDKVIVSTDSNEIANEAKKYGAVIEMRPAGLATDTAPTEPSLIHSVSELEKLDYKPDFIVLLQPTSPIRKGKDIDKAIKKLSDEKADSLLSVQENKHFLWKQTNDNLVPVNYDFRQRPRRQDRQPEFLENGNIYITSYDVLMEQKNRLGGKISYYVMNEYSSIEIDSLFDFWLCEMIIKHKKKGVENEKDS